MPNAGKSTLLAAVTAARPKIADYPFTTLAPNLGVVKAHGDATFVLADIPGLIEGAHEGVGLGQAFLRHIERTRLLIHLVDASAGSGEELLHRYAQVQAELKAYQPALARRPQVLALNKMDLVSDPKAVDAFQRAMLRRRRRVFLISAATGAGCKELMEAVYPQLQAALRQKPRPRTLEAPALKVYRGPTAAPPFELTREGQTFVVQGPAVERLLAMTDLKNPDALRRFQRKLESWGLSTALAARGARGGETVRIRDIEFLYDGSH
jgi:GTP-binding protein